VNERERHENERESDNTDVASTCDETNGAAGSVTHSIFVRFTSNFVHLHSLPPLQERVMSRFSLINFFLPKFLLDVNLEITDGKGNAT
jgi:transcriptional regulator with AAA-type ATPase domain